MQYQAPYLHPPMLERLEMVRAEDTRRSKKKKSKKNRAASLAAEYQLEPQEDNDKDDADDEEYAIQYKQQSVASLRSAKQKAELYKSTSVRSGTIIARRGTVYHRRLEEQPHLYRDLIEYDSELEDMLEPGDLIVSNGHGISSGVIKFFSWSDWSHIGVVDRRDGLLCLWESVRLADGAMDLLTESRTKSGLRLVSLRELARVHPCNYFGVIKLDWSQCSDPSLQDRAIDALHRFQTLEHEKQYETSTFTLIRLAVDCCFLGRNSLDLNSFFCSELVAETYKAMGLLPRDFNSSDCLPSDFFDINLMLLHRVQVACLMYVAPPPAQQQQRSRSNGTQRRRGEPLHV